MKILATTLGLLTATMLVWPASAAVRYASITDGASTAVSENGCPAWVLEGNDDDCSYDGGNPLDLGTTQWVGPVFSAGYYAPGAAEPVYENGNPPGPVTAPAPELALGGKTGIPVARGFISIDDRDSPDGRDDVISSTIELGAFQRNVAVSSGKRTIESIDRIIHRVGQVRVSSAVANGSGGYDYVVAKSESTAAYPSLLSGSTTSGGGFSDSFPSEIGSQSTADVSDLPYWSAPGPNGIARLDDTSAVLGTFTSATVWGYSCDDGNQPPGPSGCFTNGVNWDGDNRASISNLLLKISTDGSGNVLSAEAILVNESDLSPSVEGNDSWTATTLNFAATQTDSPEAFDDRRVLQLSASEPPADTSTTVDVLANDLFSAGPAIVEIITPPASGTASIPDPVNAPGRIRYQTASTPESEQVIVYQFTDANLSTATAELHILVTDPLACEDDGETAGDRDSDTTVDVTANDSGFDIPPVTVSLASSPETGTTVVNPDRTITFSPPPDTGGLFNFSYTLNDGANSPKTCDFSIRLPALPEAVDDTQGISIDTATSIDVLANDLEVSDTPLTLAIIDLPLNGTAVADPAGVAPKVRYTPDAGYTGVDSFTYQVTDTDGDISNVATVSISVFGPPENDVPACANDTADTDRNVAATADVLENDTGLNAAPITVEITTELPAGSGSAVVNPDNTITFTPLDDKGGTFVIAYRASEALNSPVQCTLTVRVDDLPVAVDDDFDALNFGRFVVFQLLNNDTGLSDSPITLEITQQPAHGTVNVCDEEGPECPGYSSGLPPFVTYRYDDAAGYPAVDTFEYRLVDDDGDASSNATVTITPKNTVTASDDPDNVLTTPTDFRTAAGYPVTLDVLANDNGLLRTPISMAIVSQPSRGTATVNADNTITYRAPANFTGFVTFSYELTDADDASDTASVQVFVFPAPVTDSGGSALDLLGLALLGSAVCTRVLRRRERRDHRPTPNGSANPRQA